MCTLSQVRMSCPRGASNAEHKKKCSTCQDDACPECDGGSGCNKCFKKYYCSRHFRQGLKWCSDCEGSFCNGCFNNHRC